MLPLLTFMHSTRRRSCRLRRLRPSAPFSCAFGARFFQVETLEVFAALPEYFQGTMFLTTNRVTTFDDAFRSRRYFAIKFGDLSTKAKKKIWETFLQKIPIENKVSGEDIDNLSRKNFNG
jgi:SpoVK/Ycf46/Vps4 family AAA+-type ATPase